MIDFEKKILLVEDDSNDVVLIKRAFQKAKLANPIVVASDGQEAIDYLEGCKQGREECSPPVLVLLDLKLPRKNGLEVLEWIRSIPRLKRLPVVVLTSSAESKDVNTAYDLGANSYLVKPVAFESLIDLVKTLGLYWLILNKKPEF